MEILYLWVKEYKGIFFEQGFNFSSKFRFDFNSREDRLLISDTPNHIKDFFSIADQQARITNITGVIGVNGAGKTSLLDLIRENLVWSEAGIKLPMLVAIE